MVGRIHTRKKSLEDGKCDRRKCSQKVNRCKRVIITLFHLVLLCQAGGNVCTHCEFFGGDSSLKNRISGPNFVRDVQIWNECRIAGQGFAVMGGSQSGGRISAQSFPALLHNAPRLDNLYQRADKSIDTHAHSNVGI